MKIIWIFNHYATKPDEPNTRDFDIARQLAKKGDRITIFASAFSHYKQKIKYLKSHEDWKTEELDGVKFFWIRAFPYEKNNWKRFLNMISYSYRVFKLAKKIDENPDIIIGTCVHPFAALVAYFVSKKKRCRFFFMVRDLWPQTLVDIGYLSSNNPFVWILAKLEKFLYNKAEKIITVLPNAGDYITGLGIPKEKIIWIPNGVDLSRYADIKEYKGGNTDNFVFMYTGIFANYANLDIVLKAAKILKDKGKNNIKFILIGDGLEKENLVKMAEDLGVSNVEFRNMVPKNEIFKIMEEADAFISIIKDMPVLKYGISSNKLNDYMASGRPVIFAVNAKNNPVEESRAGITIPPGNDHALAEACEKIISLPLEERIEMGKRGMEYIKKNHNIETVAQKMASLF